MRRSIAALCLVAVRRSGRPRSRRQGLLPGGVSGKGVRDSPGGCHLVQGIRHHIRQSQVQGLLDDHPIPAAEATTFAVLDRGLSKDSTAVYWTDGGVLSDDPAHFAIVSNNDHYLFTKDGRTVHVNGKPIADADPTTFHVLQGAYAQDGRRFFYFTDPVIVADAASFRALDGPYARDARRVYGWAR